MPVIARDSAYLAALTPHQLYGELALAAHRLANHRLVAAKGGWPAMCHDCGAKHPADLLNIPHQETCLTGGVVRVLVALGLAELHQAFDRQSTPPRKETTAPEDGSTDAAARETRPRAIPFLVTEPAAAGLHGEPWGIDDADGSIHDAAGNTIVDPVGCELAEPDDARIMHRIVACVNYCDGIATQHLKAARLLAVEVGGVQ